MFYNAHIVLIYMFFRNVLSVVTRLQSINPLLAEYIKIARKKHLLRFFSLSKIYHLTISYKIYIYIYYQVLLIISTKYIFNFKMFLIFLEPQMFLKIFGFFSVKIKMDYFSGIKSLN
jgi:hypothetical protein